MEEFLFTGIFGCVLIALCCLNIYELLRYIGNRLPNMTMPPRLRVLMVVGCIFIAHITNIWFFGIIYYYFHLFQLGALNGPDQTPLAADIVTSLYYSGVVYTTLGLGDLVPSGALRMITNVESLTGFILIGWTVSFTYLAMIRFWEIPHSIGRKTDQQTNPPPDQLPD